MEFDWDEHNVGHLADHEIDPSEAEDVFYGPVLRSDPYVEEGEMRRDLIGRSCTNRILKVVYTVRGDTLRVCTAYAANASEARAFRRRFDHA